MATIARFVYRTAAHVSWERTADAVELLSRLSTIVSEKGATVAGDSIFGEKAVIPANGTVRRFAEKRGASGRQIGERKTGQHRVEPHKN